MSGTLTYLGELSIGAICPLAVAAQADIFAQLQAQLAGLLQLQAQLTITPPTIGANIKLVAQLLAGLEVSIGLPGIDFQLTAVAALIAQLNLSLGLLLELEVLFGTAGVFAYAYEGDALSFGPQLSAALASGWPDGTGVAAKSNGIVLATVSPVTWSAMKAFFAGAAR